MAVVCSGVLDLIDFYKSLHLHIRTYFLVLLYSLSMKCIFQMSKTVWKIDRNVFYFSVFLDIFLNAPSVVILRHCIVIHKIYKEIRVIKRTTKIATFIAGWYLKLLRWFGTGLSLQCRLPDGEQSRFQAIFIYFLQLYMKWSGRLRITPSDALPTLLITSKWNEKTNDSNFPLSNDSEYTYLPPSLFQEHKK